MSGGKHLSPQEFELLARSSRKRLQPLEHLIRHLISICPACRQHWQLASEQAQDEARPVPSGPHALAAPEPAAVAPAAAQLGVALAEHRKPARQLCERLLALADNTQRMARIRRVGHHRVWALCELLEQTSRQHCTREPAHAAELAELMVEAVWHLDAIGHGGPLLNDLQARAWLRLADAQREQGDPHQAERTLAMAHFFVHQGSGELRLRIAVLELEVTLQLDQQQLTCATALLEQALEQCRAAGDAVLEAGVLLQRSTLEGETGNPDEALACAERAETLVRGDEHPELFVNLRHQRVHGLCQLGRHAEAEVLLGELLPPLYGRCSEPTLGLRRRWLEGRLAEGLGRPEEAEVAYRAVRQGFLDLHRSFEAILAALELAAIYARADREAELKQLAQDILVTFEARDIHREAIAALVLFHRAVQMQRASPEMIENLAAYLRQARHNPQLRFERPS